MQARLAALDALFGVIDAPLEPRNRITSWTGPNSPITQDEMASMTALELVAHLESWHVMGERWGPEPTHEGQARELATLLTSNPTAVAGVDDLVERLRPTYLRAILRGWEAALKADLTPDWHQVTSLIRDVLVHGDASPFPVEGDPFDDDHDFRGAKRAAVELLEELVKQHTDLTVPDAVTSECAAMLITLADDEAAWSEYSSYEAESTMDPLTVSLNWQWPIRIRGLIHLLARGKDTSWYADAQTALVRELDRDDTRGASRAVLGEGLGRLLSVDHWWVERSATEWFGAGSGMTRDRQIALTTAMAVHRYHPALYSLLAPSMIAAIGSESPVVAGWRTTSDPVQRIGEWVIEAVIRGDNALDDQVAQAFFTAAPAKIRGEALGHVAWTFMHAERVDDEIRDRFADLWDVRVEHVRSQIDDHDELHGFYWFVKSKKFATDWWLPRLKEAAELDHDLSRETYMIGKDLASAADVDPRGALDVVILLLGGRSDAGMSVFDLSRHAVPMVLARAIASGDDRLQADAEAYMNQLGEQGHLNLMAEVQAILDGSITQDDIED